MTNSRARQIRNFIKWSAIVLLSSALVLLLMFRGDWRIFTGFEPVFEPMPAEQMFLQSYGSECGNSIEGELVSQVYVTRSHNSIVFEEKHPEWAEIGPTIIRMKSGRVIIASGVHVFMVEYKGKLRYVVDRE